MSSNKNKNLAEKRIIAHLDMDAFFAAIEERDNPRLKGWPIVVGADPQEGKGRGVVSTANYKAREYGIRSALPISKAWEFSQKAKKEGKPEAVFLDGHFKRYSEVSGRIMGIVRQYSKVVEQASVDEAYFDLSDTGSYEKAQELCQRIKADIKEKEKLTASIGVGPNKLIAKIASDMQKPDGLTVITPDKVETFLEPLSIRKIPGIGPKTEQVFNKRGIYYIKDLKKYSLGELENMLGQWGREIYYKACGVDEAPLVEEYEVKSIGEQETFQTDTLDFNFVFMRMESLCQDVFRRFKESDFKNYKTVTIIVRFSGFETKNRSHTLSKSANTLKTLTIESTRLLMPFFDSRENPKKKLIRLVGVRIEKLM